MRRSFFLLELNIFFMQSQVYLPDGTRVRSGALSPIFETSHFTIFSLILTAIMIIVTTYKWIWGSKIDFRLQCRISG